MDNNNLKLKLLNISKKTGKGSLYCYYTVSSAEKYFPCKVKLDASKWDSKKNQPKRGALKDSEAATVDSLYNKLSKLISDYKYEFHALPPIQYLEKALEQPETGEKPELCVHTLLEDWIASNSQIEDETKRGHVLAAKTLKEACKHYKYTLTLDNFNYDFIQKYIKYFTETRNKKLKNSTVNLRIAVYKTFVYYLDKREIKHNIKIQNWDKLEVPKSSDETICLERNELEEILKYQPKSKKEQKIKDVIIALSHCGCRISDITQLNKNNIVNNCFVFYPRKTKTIKAVVPISKPVREILERNGGKIPSIQIVRLAKYIQELCANIKSLQKEIIHEGKLVPKYTVLTSHMVGRRTFVNLSIQKNVPLTVIMSATAHNSVDTLLKSYVDKYADSLPHFQHVFEF